MKRWPFLTCLMIAGASAATAQLSGPPAPLSSSVLAEPVEPAKVAYLKSHVVASGPIDGPFNFKLPPKFYRNRLYLVGESHGSAATHEFDAALFENIAKRTGLRDYIAECDPIQGEAFDRYIQTGDDRALRRVFDFWSSQGAQWGSEAYERKIRALRDIAARLKGAPVRVRGLDEVQDWSMTLDWLAQRGIAVPRANVEKASDASSKSKLLLAALPAPIRGEDPVLRALRVALVAKAGGLKREAVMVASYTDLATSALRGKPAYGMWGHSHVLTGAMKSGSSFAASIESSNLPAAKHIAAIVLVPIDSFALLAMPRAKDVSYVRVNVFNIDGPLMKMDGSSDLKAASSPGSVTLFSLADKGSPYLDKPDFARVLTSFRQNLDPADPMAPAVRFMTYIGVVRGSDWAKPRSLSQNSVPLR